MAYCYPRPDLHLIYVCRLRGIGNLIGTCRTDIVSGSGLLRHDPKDERVI
jgi:hypothetical protein